MLKLRSEEDRLKQQKSSVYRVVWKTGKNNFLFKLTVFGPFV